MSNCETTRQNRRNGLVFNTPGTRYTPVNPYLQGFTQQQLDMRRKAEILQYNKTSNGKPTKKQAWGTLVRGATQRKQYTSYYLKNLQDGLLDPEQICPNDKFIPTSSKNAGVPGPEITLYYDPTVPLYNYNSMQIAYGTQNSDEQQQPKWLLNYDTNVTDNNMQKIFTLNIRPSIDEPVYVFSFTTSVGLYISGNTTQPDGVFSMGIPSQQPVGNCHLRRTNGHSALRANRQLLAAFCAEYFWRHSLDTCDVCRQSLHGRLDVFQYLVKYCAKHHVRRVYRLHTELRS